MLRMKTTQCFVVCLFLGKKKNLPKNQTQNRRMDRKQKRLPLS